MTTVAEDFAEQLKQRSQDSPVELDIDEQVLATTPLSDEEMGLFVGHRIERAALLTGVDACLRKVYRKMIMYGEAGIGKTSLASVAAQGGDLSEQYRTIILDKTQYVKGIDTCYDHIISILCGFLIDDVTTHMRTKSDYTLKTGCQTLLKNLILETNNSEEEIVRTAMKMRLIEDNKEQLYKRQDVIKALAKKLERRRIMLVIDDVHEIFEDRLKFQELVELSNIEDWFSLFIMHTREYVELKERLDPLTKDAFVFEIRPLSMDECKEMIRRRLFYSKDKQKEVESPPIYSNDLSPFSEKAVEIVASTVNYNPLTLIEKLKEAIVLARKEKVTAVTDEIAMRIITKNTQKTPLTPRLKEVLDFVREKGKVTIQDVADMRGKGRISAYFILRDLYDANLLDKKREGRKILYIIKTAYHGKVILQEKLGVSDKLIREET